MFAMKPMLILLLCASMAAGMARAGNYTWNNTGSNWFSDANWDGDAGYPGNGDTATMNAGTLVLTNETGYLASFTMGGGTLPFTNWNTKLSAMSITLTAGTVTHGDNSDTNGADGWTADARVWMACSNLSVGSSAFINVKGKGYRGGTNQNDFGCGPGAASAALTGAAHGGYGGNNPTSLYGVASTPAQPGSGGAGNWAGQPLADGGGGVKIDADLDVLGG